MAIYEIRNSAKRKTIETKHDREEAISFAQAETDKTGDVLEVYEIKHVHMTTAVKGIQLSAF